MRAKQIHEMGQLTMTCNIKEAKKNIDLILSLAESGKPQVIKRGHKEVAVIVSVDDWKRLCDDARDPKQEPELHK